VLPLRFPCQASEEKADALMLGSIFELDAAARAEELAEDFCALMVVLGVLRRACELGEALAAVRASW